MRGTIVALASVFGLCASPTLASAQPEFLNVERLQAAAPERQQFRLEIRSFVQKFFPICPLRASPKYAEYFKVERDGLDALVASLSDTQLLLDTNIAYEDALAAVLYERARVRCAPQPLTDEQAREFLTARQAALQDVEMRANRALRALESGAS